MPEETRARVGIVMGSDSDWPVMEAAGTALAEFGVAYEADVVSAHRMPDAMLAYGREAHARGIEVIVAGAGGAAHLPGMLAAVTPLPVIGVPVPLAHLDGMGIVYARATRASAATLPSRSAKEAVLCMGHPTYPTSRLRSSAACQDACLRQRPTVVGLPDSSSVPIVSTSPSTVQYRGRLAARGPEGGTISGWPCGTNVKV